jgi:hypothetical protein
MECVSRRESGNAHVASENSHGEAEAHLPFPRVTGTRHVAHEGDAGTGVAVRWPSGIAECWRWRIIRRDGQQHASFDSDPDEMTTRVAARLLLLLHLSCAPLAAQRGAPQPSRLTTGIDTLGIYLVRGTDTVSTGLLIDALSITEHVGRKALLRVYRSTSSLLGTRLDSLVDAFSDLSPIAHRSTNSQGAERVDFDAGNARGWIRIANDQVVSVDAALPSGTINASSFDLALRASDLRDGARFDMRGFAVSLRAVQPLDALVAGSDTVDGADCWRVESTFAGRPVTFWIGKTTRRLHRQLMTVRPGIAILFSRVRRVPPGSRSIGPG